MWYKHHVTKFEFLPISNTHVVTLRNFLRSKRHCPISPSNICTRWFYMVQLVICSFL